MKRIFLRISAFSLLTTLAVPVLALNHPFQNFADLATSAGFDAYSSSKSSQPVKIAILDNGFRNHAAEIGKSLPSNTVFHAGPVAVDAATEESHGLFMAQMVSALLGKAPGIAYQLHLFSSYGYSNLEAAVGKVIEEKFDVVLYAQVWEYGGNGDGKGFINALVNKATSAGIIWINAAGNFATGTYRAPIAIGDDDWVKLPSPNQTLRLRCQKGTSKSNTCKLRLVLSWNDFKDDVSAGTDKDLDLILSDDTLKIVSSSALEQVKQTPEGSPPGKSLYPREIITTDLKPGLYFARVKARSKNFDSAIDRLRLTVSGENVELLDQKSSDTLLPPADNPTVITIGASDSVKSSSSSASLKPELNFASKVVLKNGEEYRGNSNSSAVAAAAVAVLKALKPELVRERLVSLLASGPATFHPETGEGHGLPLGILGFQPTGNGCFKTAQLPIVPTALEPLVKGGAVVVESTKGFKIFLPVDPVLAIPGVFRVSPDDMIVVGLNGYEPLPRSSQDFLPFGFYEVVQQPFEQVVCAQGEGGLKPVPSGAKLKLPSPQAL